MKTVQQVDRQLHDLMRNRRRLMQQYFKGCGLFNGEPPMLFFIAEQDGITQKELAQRMQITPASVTVSVRRMETEGLVQRIPDTKDARVLHLHLTPKGRHLNQECLQVRDDLIRRLFCGYDAQDIEQMSRLLDKMEQNLNLARHAYLGESDLQKGDTEK